MSDETKVDIKQPQMQNQKVVINTPTDKDSEEEEEGEEREFEIRQTKKNKTYRRKRRRRRRRRRKRKKRYTSSSCDSSSDILIVPKVGQNKVTAISRICYTLSVIFWTVSVILCLSIVAYLLIIWKKEPHVTYVNSKHSSNDVALKHKQTNPKHTLNDVVVKRNVQTKQKMGKHPNSNVQTNKLVKSTQNKNPITVTVDTSMTPILPNSPRDEISDWSENVRFSVTPTTNGDYVLRKGRISHIKTRNAQPNERRYFSTNNGVTFGRIFELLEKVRGSKTYDCLAHHNIASRTESQETMRICGSDGKCYLSPKPLESLNLITIWLPNEQNGSIKINAINLRKVGHVEGVFYRPDLVSPRYDDRKRYLKYRETIFVKFVDYRTMMRMKNGKKNIEQSARDYYSYLELNRMQSICVQVLLDEMSGIDPFLKD